MRPDNDSVLVKKWIYLGGAVCYNCRWETLIEPAPKSCPQCGHLLYSRFRGEWKRKRRTGFGLTCSSCKNSRRRSGGRLLKGKSWYRDVKIGERLKCKLCGSYLTSNIIRT